MEEDEEQRVSSFSTHHLNSVLYEIMVDLMQPNTIIFGVIISGDGKRKVAQIINDSFERNWMFDAVVMASVTENPDLQRIQEELGNKLNLQLNQITTLNERATLLCDKIKTKDKILIILDDLHDEIDLAKIGIPFGNDHKGCKVLLLAQTPELLYDKMKSQELYLIDSEADYEPIRFEAGASTDIRQNSESMNSNLKEIIKALTTQPHMSILGLYGSSYYYARKREMLEQITRRVERDGGVVVNVKANAVKKNTRLFWSNKSLHVKIIQVELANELALQLHDKTNSKERATRLCDMIKTKEKILIILHDLQGRIDLGKIGIPFGNNHKGCKIILVAETQEVLCNQINAPQIKFSVYD